MSDNKRWFHVVSRQVVVIALLCGFGQAAWAQKPAVTFQESTADILKVLSVKPLQNKAKESKGVGGIAPDYKALVANLPTKMPARALILFDIDSARLDPKSYPVLRNYAAALQELPDAVVLIAGHTDSTGADQYNMDLSALRAQAVTDFLTQQCQVDTRQLNVGGYGKRQPLASNRTETGRAINRRVEFIRVQ